MATSPLAAAATAATTATATTTTTAGMVTVEENKIEVTGFEFYKIQCGAVEQFLVLDAKQNVSSFNSGLQVGFAWVINARGNRYSGSVIHAGRNAQRHVLRVAGIC